MILENAPILLKEFALNKLTAFGVPDFFVQIAGALMTIGVVLGIFMGLFALTSVIERKTLARIQNRYGPNRVGPFGLFQPMADGIKMITKEDIIPQNADKIVHFLAPVVMVIPALLVLAILPYGRGMAPVDLQVGVLFFFATSAGTELAVFMAGWSSNNKYSVLGGMRAIAQMISYELPLVLSTVVVAMIAGSLSPVTIVDAQGGYSLGFVPHWFVFTPWGFLGCVLFYLGAMAESNRSPFDLPEGESELIAGHLTEYSGFKYATFFMAEYIGMFAISGLLVTLFLGGWQAPMPFLQVVPSWCWFFGKLCFVVLSMIWVRATMPRIRIDQLMAFAWKFILPMSLVNILAVGIWHFAGNAVAAWIGSAALIGAAYVAFGTLYNRTYPVAKRHYIYAE